MSSPFKYKDGDFLGPYNIKMIHRTKKVKNIWYALFECPYCKQQFETMISSIVNGSTKSCGCYKKEATRKRMSKDLSGCRFGKLTVIKQIPANQFKNNRIHWLCKCDCGNSILTITHNLTSGKTTKCWECYVKENRQKDITGQTFGKLIALYPTEKRSSNQCVIWHCQCECGNYIDVPTDVLTTGNTKSCGCIISCGENQISKILKDLSINYTTQKTFSECVNPLTNAKLKFDFYLPDYNCCIEYDGKQHYESYDRFGGIEGLNDRQYRDGIKNKYCEENRINLIRIPYYDYGKINKSYILHLLEDLDI